MNRHPMHYASVEPDGCLCPDCVKQMSDPNRVTSKVRKLDSCTVLDTVPTGRDTEVTHDMWDPQWIEKLVTCTEAVTQMTADDLARSLEWANEHSCYYHSELCDLLSACVKEAARRLRG